VQRVEEPSGLPVRSQSWELTGLRRALGPARDHARQFLEAGSDDLAEDLLQDALVVVAELVSNAIRHAPGPCVLTLSQDGGRLLVSVRDGSASSPTPRPPDLSAGGGGFGWHLVQRLSERVEVHTHGESGKTVTATLVLVGGVKRCEV